MSRRKINKLNQYPVHTTFRHLHSVLRTSDGRIVYSVVTPTAVRYVATSLYDIPDIIPNKHGQRVFKKSYIPVLQTYIVDEQYTGNLFMYCKHELSQPLRPITDFTTINPTLWSTPSDAYMHVCIGMENNHPICLKPISKESKRIYANKGTAGNHTRTKSQMLEDTGSRFRTKIIEAVTGVRPKIEYTHIYNKFNGQCFKCHIPITNTTDSNLDHTLPHSLYYPYNEHTATLLCVSCNQGKNNKWPTEFYNIDQLHQLETLTGLSLQNSTKQYNLPIFLQFNMEFDRILDTITRRFRKHRLDTIINKLEKDIYRANKLNPHPTYIELLNKLLYRKGGYREKN